MDIAQDGQELKHALVRIELLLERIADALDSIEGETRRSAALLQEMKDEAE